MTNRLLFLSATPAISAVRADPEQSGWLYAASPPFRRNSRKTAVQTRHSRRTVAPSETRFPSTHYLTALFLGELAVALEHGDVPFVDTGTIAASWPIRNIVRPGNR